MTIKEIIAKKAELIALKKAEIKTVKGGVSALFSGNVTKGVFENSDTELKRTIVANTYNWLDSHQDVHAKGVFSKSIKERKDIFHLHDHEFKLTAKVGEPIKVYEDVIKWSDLGINKQGETTALFMDSNILKDYNERIFNEYKNGKINQHSVGMQYVKIDLAVNDEDEEDEYKVWQDNIDSIGNKEEAEKLGYFWLIREAKLIEISAVLMGSNSLTPTINEPEKSTQKQEPLDNTQKELELFYNKILKN
jgi:hypothetical protein